MAILRPMGEVVQLPEDVTHDAVSLERLAYRILALGEDTKVLMEATGRYHEPIAAGLHEHGIFVSVVNPLVIHNYSTDSSVRKGLSTTLIRFTSSPQTRRTTGPCGRCTGWIRA